MKSILVMVIVAVLSLLTQGCAYDQANRYSYEYGQEKGLSAEAQVRISLLQQRFELLNDRLWRANAYAESRRVELLNSGISAVESDPFYATWDQERSNSVAQAIEHTQELKYFVAQMNTSELKAMHRWIDSWEARDGWFTKILRTIV